MKTQIITIALLLATLSFTSCKNNEAKSTENQVATEPTTQVEVATPVKDTTAKTTEEANEKSSEKGEKNENEANEKNDKD